jgi:hypothetical protein
LQNMVLTFNFKHGKGTTNSFFFLAFSKLWGLDLAVFRNLRRNWRFGSKWEEINEKGNLLFYLIWNFRLTG